MSQTLAVTEDRVRKKIDDLDSSAYALTTERMRDLIIGTAKRLSSEWMIGEVWDTLGTMALGDHVVSVSPSFEYNAIRAVKDEVTGLVLKRTAPEEIARIFGQEADLTKSPMGPPSAYALLEYNGALTVRLDARVPQDHAGFDLLALRSLQVPDTFTDATVIPFSKLGCYALELKCAAASALMMTPKNRERLGLSDQVVAALEASANKAVADESWRLYGLRGADDIVQVEA